MGNAVYAQFLEEPRSNMEEDKAADVVEALLSLQWFQERAINLRLDLLGDMTGFHNTIMEDLATQEPGARG